jgi:hypothetical protein
MIGGYATAVKRYAWIVPQIVPVGHGEPPQDDGQERRRVHQERE